VLTVLTWSRLRAVDASAVVPERELHLLQSVPLFSPLPPTTLERLAAQLAPTTAMAGTELIRQGDRGDLFYVIATGHVDVSQDGHHIAKLGPGGYFGEIALLNDVPRVATCSATADTELYTLSRNRFVSAVTGNQTSANEIETVINNRLTELQSRRPT
jgi:CRP-like cAMP-binding protein